MAGNVVSMIPRATGPRSLAGKRRSALNALKGGLYASSTCVRHLEDIGEFNSFARAIVADLDARSTLEIALAERLCSALWRGRRVHRYEAEKLSEAADRADLVAKAANRTRLVAETIAGYGDAVAALARDGSIDAVTVRKAAEGFAAVYSAETGTESLALALRSTLEALARRDKPVASKAIRAALATANESMPIGLAGRDVDELIESTAHMLREIARRVGVESDGQENKARRSQADALLLEAHEATRVDDAERRIDRQIARALADFQAGRGLTAQRESQLAATAS